MTIEHKEGCWYPQALEDEQIYIEAWPGHCTNCHGWGGFVESYDPSPAGVALSPGSIQEYDPCPECLENRLCPRCGSSVDSYEDWDAGQPARCPGCGFIEEETPGRPFADNEPCSCMEPEEPDDWCWRVENAPY